MKVYLPMNWLLSFPKQSIKKCGSEKFLKIIVTISKLADLLHLPLNSEQLKKMTESYVVSNVKIKKALHLNKLPLTVGEGLEKIIRSFTENN